MLKRICWVGLFMLLVCSVQASPFEKGAAYQVCFTPGQNCTQEIVDAIDGAISEIWVQAYGFTSKPIAQALVTAQQRGVKVQIILDKSNRQDPRSAWYFMRHGIPVTIDSEPGIAHNKVMVIDQTRVITGSFNFTNAAQNRNAENVLIIDDESLAKKYLMNWQRHRQISQPMTIPNNGNSPHLPNQENWLEQFLDWLLQFLRQWILK